MHSNSYYNPHQPQQQRHVGVGTVPSALVHVSAQQGIDADHCHQSTGHSGSSSSSSTSSSQAAALHGIVPGPRTNPHSYAEYYNSAGSLTRYNAPASDCLGTAVVPGLSQPSTTSATTVACSSGLRRDDSDSVRPPCRQADTGPTSAGSSCQYSGTPHQYIGGVGTSVHPTCGSQIAQLSSTLSSQPVDWSSGHTGTASHQPQQRSNLTGYVDQQHPSQGAVWMAGCADYRPQVASTTHSQFPDSPPDSGSEPYSPPNDNRRLATVAPGGSTHQGLPHPSSQSTAATGSASGMAAHMYMNQQPAHRSYVGHPHHEPCLVAGPGHQPQYLPDQSPGVAPYCMSRTTPGYSNSGALYPHVTVDAVKQLAPTMMVTHLNAQALAVQYGSLHNAANHPPKKRKYSDSPPGTLTPDLMNSVGMTSTILPIKPEPCPPDLHYGLATGDCSEDDSYSYDFNPDGGIFLDGSYQVIKWTSHQPTKWCTLIDETGKDLSAPMYRVDADKGFNHAPPDDAFVCQKKNHFQITVHVGISGMMTPSGCTTLPKFIRLPEEGGVVPIDALYLHFYGIKMESPTQTIKIEQSQSDRSKKPFHPVRIELSPDQVTKVTVGRLHFSETTSNNMRKKGKPNPDQRYFQLVVSLMAHCGADKHMLAAQVSERIIVRASNPGQFENDMEALWSKGKTSESVYHSGRVGVNTDSPDEALTVHGNVKVTGHVISPSDMRAKKDILELDTSEQLRNISQLKVYQYQYDDDFAEYAGLLDQEQIETGVLAQQVQTVLPDAVRETGDVVLNNGRAIDNFLVVNKDRIFIENVGAVKELCKVTDKLENRITEIEIINKKLTKYSSSGARGHGSNMKSTCSHSSISISTTSSISQRDNKSTASTVSHAVDQTSKVNSSSLVQHHRHRHRHGQGHHRRDSRLTSSACSMSISSREQAICSNRAIHISVIILVAVMAVCLLSITVLYVVDRKVTPSMNPAPALLAHTQTPSRPHSSTSSPYVTTPLLLPIQCQTDLMECHYTCCAAPTPSPFNDQEHPGTLPMTEIVTQPTMKVVDKSTRSPNDVRQHFTNLEKKGLQTPSILRRGRRYIQDNTIRNAPVAVHLSTTTELNNEIDAFPLPEVIPHERDRPEDDPSPEGSQDDSPLSNPDSSMRDKTAVLFLKQLNTTITPVYCNDPACSQQTGGNYTYTIPLNPRFPKLPVAMQFIMQGSTTSSYVLSLCNQTLNSACSEIDGDSSTEFAAIETRMSMEWELPIAVYQNSLFKFRIGVRQDQSQSNLCSLPKSGVDSEFIEYNLYFYRVCAGTYQ